MPAGCGSMAVTQRSRGAARPAGPRAECMTSSCGTLKLSEQLMRRGMQRTLLKPTCAFRSSGTKHSGCRSAWRCRPPSMSCRCGCTHTACRNVGVKLARNVAPTARQCTIQTSVQTQRACQELSTCTPDNACAALKSTHRMCPQL